MTSLADKRLRNFQLRANDAEANLMVLTKKAPPWDVTGFVVTLHIESADELEALLAYLEREAE